MSSSKKIEEALEHIRLAEKSLKTGLLKWRPDYDIACDEYQKAATCYRNAKSLDQCKECLMKAAECHMENRSLFHAAKCFEQVILVLKEQNNFGEIESLAHRACRLYQQQGSPEAAASALDKAAKIIENIHPEQALNLYQHAIEVVMVINIFFFMKYV
ncbi:Gamma-soluble NSF attachment protein [Pseudolycoriella hygida]|uniref:Gamma-soluble NSF attachment protein n=1 Tax=Pseudolycoriella hygida TaxID=35572 RepID=A0A9Q0NDD1_9DIPT|nr:Gamma-soluble NSF attachment protein [Pseudolycoriella hygida]